MTPTMLGLCLLLNVAKITKAQACVAPDGNNNAKYESALQSLTNMGYKVIEGNLTFLVNSTAFGANPSSIYGIFQFGTSSDIIETAEIAWRPFSGCDAVLFTGCTPPKMKYFSFAPYIYQRFNGMNQSHRNMEILFASLGASVNNLVINSTDYNDWNVAHDSNNNYDSLTTVITTADEQTFNDISSQLNKIGLLKTVNLNSIPIEYTNFVPYNATGITYTTQVYIIHTTFLHTEFVVLYNVHLQ